MKIETCYVCGDTESGKYCTWIRDGEYLGKKLCNKHYNQLIRNGKLSDTIPSKHTKRIKWTVELDNELEQLYKDGKSFDEISQIMDLNIGSIVSRSYRLKLGCKYIRSNNVNFKAIYQDYDWCYDRFINKGMSHEEMAKECGASLRVIQKWCAERHKLNARTYKKIKRISDLQYQIIMFGTLGDGHIDKRENAPLYIESHAEDEKDYLYWKYEQLKNICNSEPKYYPSTYTKFGTDKKYYCQPTYRFETRVINQLKEIRDMPRIEKINQLNELGLSLHVLDDGYRSKKSSWEICLAEYTQEEIDRYIEICNKKWKLTAKQQKDNRYIRFNVESSKKIDSIILNVLPNNLDIIKKKIPRDIIINNTELKYAI